VIFFDGHILPGNRDFAGEVSYLLFGCTYNKQKELLNNFVAIHYNSNHMSWLHCCWGAGATLGPMIMSLFIAKNNQWQKGYFTISIIQFCLVFILLITLPLWKRIEKNDNTIVEEEDEENTHNIRPLRIPGVKLALVSFIFYCGTEFTAGLWEAVI